LLTLFPFPALQTLVDKSERIDLTGKFRNKIPYNLRIYLYAKTLHLILYALVLGYGRRVPCHQMETGPTRARSVCRVSSWRIAMIRARFVKWKWTHSCRIATRFRSTETSSAITPSSNCTFTQSPEWSRRDRGILYVLPIRGIVLKPCIDDKEAPVVPTQSSYADIL